MRKMQIGFLVADVAYKVRGQRKFHCQGTLYVLCLLVWLGCLCSCRPKPSVPPQKDRVPPRETISAVVPSFDADSAFAFVAKQVAFGPRIPGHPAHAACAKWLEEKLRSYRANVVVQRTEVEVYNGQKVPCINIIASYGLEHAKRLLLCAHWDNRPWSDQDPEHPRKPFDGANDGGSGVAVLLECARHFAQHPPAVGIDIIFFDVEDYGAPVWEKRSSHHEEGYCLGSRYWIEYPHVPNYRAYYGILLDMVGAAQATFLQEGHSLTYAPSVVEKVWETAAMLGYGNYFLPIRGPAIVDDHTYINQLNFTPTIDIIHLSKETSTGFFPQWHTQHDNLSIIDRNTLKAVGQTLLHVVYSESDDA